MSSFPPQVLLLSCVGLCIAGLFCMLLPALIRRAKWQLAFVEKNPALDSMALALAWRKVKKEHPRYFLNYMDAAERVAFIAKSRQKPVSMSCEAIWRAYQSHLSWR